MLFLRRTHPPLRTQSLSYLQLFHLLQLHDRADKFNSDCSGTRWQLKTTSTSGPDSASLQRKGKVGKCSWDSLVKGRCYWAVTLTRVFQRSLPSSLLLQSSAVVLITQPSLGSPSVSDKPDYICFNFTDISFPCSLPYLFFSFISSWSKLLYS